jgi:hypothetical protein
MMACIEFKNNFASSMGLCLQQLAEEAPSARTSLLATYHCMGSNA